MVSILFEGQPISGKVAQAIVKQGLSHVPEGRRVFANMSVEENLELGAYLRKDKQGIKEDFDKVYNLFPRLLSGVSSTLVRYQAVSSRCSPWAEP